MAPVAAPADDEDGSQGDAMKSYSAHRTRPPRERVLAIDEGQVVCPRRGIVGIELCWACPAYRGLTTRRLEGVICGTEPEFLAVAARWPVGHERPGDPLEH